MQQLLSPRQFAAAIGVSESSVRRWADSGRIKMARTTGGHRKIARSEAIRFIRETSANVVRPDLLEIGEPKQRRRRTAAFAAQHDELLNALVSGQSDIAAGLLTTMYVNGVSAAEICDGPLRYAMHEIGNRWPAEKRGIFLEHRATTICMDALNRLQLSFPRSSSVSAVAIGGAPANDPYSLPSQMVATVLADVGFQPINLGYNTPLDVLAEAALDVEAKIVWVACTAPLPKLQTDEQLAQLASELGRAQTHLVLGGQSAFRYQVPPGAHFHLFSSLAEMAEFAGNLMNAIDDVRRHAPGRQPN